MRCDVTEADDRRRRFDWLAQRLHAEPRQPMTVDDFVASWAA